MRRNFLIIISFVLFSLGPWVSAKQLEIEAVYADQSGKVSVVVAILPSIIPKTSDFRLVEDDSVTVKASQVKSFRQSNWKLDMVLSVDTSGTMKGQPLTETRQALNQLISQNLFKTQDRIALFSFENRLTHNRWFEFPQQDFKNAIDELKWLHGQKTVLYDGLYESLEELEALEDAPPRLRRILVISDGKDEGSKHNIEDVRTKALALRVHIDVVARVRKDRAKEDLERGFVQDLRSLSDKTGGFFVHAEPGKVGDAIDQIFQEIMDNRVVYFTREIESPAPSTQAVGVQLQLHDDKSLRTSISAEIPQTRRPTWPIWLFGILIALIALSAVVWIRGKGGGKPPKKAPTPTPAPLRRAQKPPPKPPHPAKPERVTSISSNYYFPSPALGRPAAVLVGVSGSVVGQRFLVDKERISIGADSGVDLTIGGDQYVSGYHAYLSYEGGSLLLFDQKSKNGTFVNDKRVVDSPSRLEPGDRIKIGASIFELSEASSTLAANQDEPHHTHIR
jgi:Mg-chelatase subunit ChlD